MAVSTHRILSLASISQSVPYRDEREIIYPV
jgi:hypothetical protein